MVAGRKTLEDWLEAGDRAYLSLVVDPDSGESFDDLNEYPFGFLDEICNPTYRQELIRKRSGEQVAEPFTDSAIVHSRSWGCPNISVRPS